MAVEPELAEDVVVLDESEQGLNLLKYWAALVKRWRLVALCVSVTLAAAALYSVLSRPLYRATVLLDVQPERPNPLDIGQTGSTPNYVNVGPEFLATQMQLMQTREIGERVVRRLNLVNNREFYPSRNRVSKNQTVSRADEEVARVAGLVTRSLETRPVRQIGTTTRDTTLVQLSAVASSPRLAADIANTVGEEYIAWNAESRYGTAGRATGFLASQIDQTRKELEAKSQQLLAYGKQKEIVSTDPQASIYAQKLDFNYDAAVADRVSKEARYHDLQNARPDSVADTLSSGLVSQLRAEQARMEREYAEKLNLFKPDWPAMRQLKTQIDTGREHLNSVMSETVAKAREAAKNDYLSALRREESLKATMRAQKSEAMKFNSDVVEYNNLKLEVDTKRALLDTLLRRQAEVDVNARLGPARESATRIAERARPPAHAFRPSYTRNGLLALLLGGGLGIGLALLLEFLDRSLRTPEQVEQQLHLPALGVIPALDWARRKAHGYIYSRKLRKKALSKDDEPGAIELLPHNHPRSLLAERYRAFRAALLLSRAGGIRSILITSSFAREGKTATAANLAVVLGQLGKRVLLVDADLHRPRVHEVFGVSNRTGLVSILAENLSPERPIVKTEIPGVFVLPSGPSTPNPSGLLSSDAMTSFLELARMNYDYVVLDAPPVAAVADALVLGHQTDGVVLCVEGGKTPREQVRRVRDRLLRANVRILGVLINNVTEVAGGYGALDYDVYYGDMSGYTLDQPAAAARTL